MTVNGSKDRDITLVVWNSLSYTQQPLGTLNTTAQKLACWDTKESFHLYVYFVLCDVGHSVMVSIIAPQLTANQTRGEVHLLLSFVSVLILNQNRITIMDLKWYHLDSWVHDFQVQPIREFQKKNALGRHIR